MSSHHTTDPYTAAIYTVDWLIELVGRTTAYDRLIGRLLLTDPLIIRDTCEAVIAAVLPDTDQGVLF